MKRLGSTMIEPSLFHKPTNIPCVTTYTPHML